LLQSCCSTRRMACGSSGRGQAAWPLACTAEPRR
jgi:hypothetical protein